MEPSSDGTKRGPEPTYWERLAKTIFINIAFLLALGLYEGARGPTLLDLTEIYQTDVETISFMFLISSVGSLIGAFFTGWIMDKYPGFQAQFMFIFTFLLGAIAILFPFLGHLYVFFAAIFVAGFNSGALDTGGNVYCLNIWRGLDSGPYMHSIHFSFSVGSFMAPLIAAPFLSELGSEKPQDTQITIYYPIIGVIAMLVSLGFVYFAIQEWRMHKMTSDNGSGLMEEHPTTEPKQTKWKVVLVCLVAVFFFLYAGVEYSLAIYLTTFAVECDLGLTKVQGAELTALFWGCFAAMRFLAIFLAIKVNPTIVMVFSFVLSLIAGLVLCIWAETSLLILQIGTAVIGVGLASMYATGILWLEKYVPITGKIGAMFSIAASLGPDTYPIIVGHFITRFPMFLMYLSFVTTVVCLLIFSVACFIGPRVKKNDQKTGKDGPQEMDVVQGKVT